MHPTLTDRRHLLWHLAAWILAGAVLGVLVHVLIGTPWQAAFVFSLPLAVIAAPASLSAWYVCRAMPLSRTPVLRVAATSLGAALVTAVLWSAVGRFWWGAIGRAGVATGPEETDALVVLLVGVGALAYLLTVAVQYLVQASEESAEAARRVLESEVGQREAELRALRAQVDPHFLFNSLNAIAGLIGPAPEAARRMCGLLGDFLRDSLHLGGAARIPLAREVALAEQYLKIEQVRFGSRLTVRALVSADSAEVPVPSLILQPLVENAVRHGIATRLDGGTIELDARRMGERVVVAVSNPRDPDLARRGTGFGQDIVRRRLEAAFGDRAALAVEAAPEHYRVSLTIPVDAVHR
jgi:two-component system, LytTR family, sensor histidine kinase AlgZ